MEEEKLIDFLNRGKQKDSEVKLCLWCSTLFDKEAHKGLKGVKPPNSRKSK